MTKFGWISERGEFGLIGEVDQADMLKCPFAIMAFEHYRPDGTCRCNDKSHTEMKEWGYVWAPSLGRWTA